MASQFQGYKNPKLLGVVFDSTFTYNTHAAASVRKTHARLKVLRDLVHTLFGKDKDLTINDLGAEPWNVIAHHQ